MLTPQEIRQLDVPPGRYCYICWRCSILNKSTTKDSRQLKPWSFQQVKGLKN
jgi:hypothetical protein